MIVEIGTAPLALASLRGDCARTAVPIERRAAAAYAAIAASALTVERIVASGSPPTASTPASAGFRRRASRPKISRALQSNIVLSHAAGDRRPARRCDGAPGARAQDRQPRSRRLGRAAGARRAACRAVQRRGSIPCIPAKGSVGASGDLAPLAHLALALLGIGDVRVTRSDHRRADALADAGLAPLALAPKEGLALLNGTQVSTALALTGLFAAEDVFAAAVVAGSLSVDAAAGSDTPFDARIHALRGHTGQRDVAARYLELLAGSEIRRSHLHNDPRVQDPYSLRCQPQVMGACLDHIRFAANVFEVEANGVTDNPLVFPDTGRGAVRRQLPRRAGGARRRYPRSGDRRDRRPLRTAHRAAHRRDALGPAAVSGRARRGELRLHGRAGDRGRAREREQDRSRTRRASTACRPRRTRRTTSAWRPSPRGGSATWRPTPPGIVAIELLAAAQGIDFRSPLRTAPRLQDAHALVRREVAFYDHDRYFAPDIAAIQRLVETAAFHEFVPGLLPSFAHRA